MKHFYELFLQNKMTTRSPQTINGIKLHNAPPNEQTLQVHTARFVVSFGTDTKRVFYEIKDESIKGEPFNIILIMICYEISGHQLCQNVDFITSFFYSIVFHLRTQIPKLLKYHKHIELIRKFFNEPSLIQHMVIPVSAFNLEVHKSRLCFISKSSKGVSSSIRKNLEEYGAFLGDSCSQIATALSKMSVQAQVPSPSPVQPKPENVWTQRQMKRTQTQTADSSESTTQTQTVSICAKTTQTDDSFAQIMRENAGLKEEIARLHELLKDNSDLKRKISQLEKRLTKTESKPEEITFTLEDHARFMKEQRDIFEKEKAKLQDKINLLKDMNRKVIENGRAELKEFKNNSTEYFRKELVSILSEYPVSQSEIGHILRISNPDDMVGPLSSWSMNIILKKYNEMIKEERLAPSCFFEFWTECVLPRIDELSPQILHTLRAEWVRFRSMCLSSSGDDTFALQVNLVFSQYIQDYKNKKYDRYVVPFFNILIHSCKNLIILVGLVNVHYCEKETPTVIDTVYEEFVCLMTLPEPLTVLKEIVELSKKKLAEAEENPYPMPPVFNKLVYGIELQSPSFFEILAESM